jgi:branched-chain amino acid transport system ATP-binding protein
LKAENIFAGYGGGTVLDGLSLEVGKGGLVALLGRNGAGKTTTIRSLMGFVKVSQGRIVFKGNDITRLPPFKRARMGIAYVPQGRGLFNKLTVNDNLRVTCQDRARESSFEDTLSLFPILKERLNQTSMTLSGGEQQMLAIARAMVSNPDLIMMDEPTMGLAPAVVSKLKGIIKSINERGVSILLTEQKPMLVLDIATEVYVIDKGQITLHRKPEELESDEDLLKRVLGVVTSQVK